MAVADAGNGYSSDQKTVVRQRINEQLLAIDILMEKGLNQKNIREIYRRFGACIDLAKDSDRYKWLLLKCLDFSEDLKAFAETVIEIANAAIEEAQKALTELSDDNKPKK